MPACGQSLTWPLGSLSWTACQRNLPVFSFKHIPMPQSIGSASPLASTLRSRVLRGFALLVPTNTLPPATTGCVTIREPSGTAHRMPSPVSGSKLSGTPRSVRLAMFRPGVPPNIGQADPAFPGGTGAVGTARQLAATATAITRGANRGVMATSGGGRLFPDWTPPRPARQEPSVHQTKPAPGLSRGRRSVRLGSLTRTHDKPVTDPVLAVPEQDVAHHLAVDVAVRDPVPVHVAGDAGHGHVPAVAGDGDLVGPGGGGEGERPVGAGGDGRVAVNERVVPVHVDAAEGDRHPGQALPVVEQPVAVLVHEHVTRQGRRPLQDRPDRPLLEVAVGAGPAQPAHARIEVDELA